MRGLVKESMVLLACLAAGAASIWSGAEREGAIKFAFAARWPVALSVESLTVRAQDALSAGRGREAVELASLAVSRAPVEPASTAMLGMARLRAGDEEGAEKAMLVAATLGWRVPFTQSYWMVRALQAGDLDVATMRLDALLRQIPAVADSDEIMDPFEATPEGRLALARRMKLHPAWVDSYVVNVDQLPVERMVARAQVMEELTRLGSSIGCDNVAPSVQRLISLGALEDAGRLWRGQCREASKALIYDGQFAHSSIDQSRSAFAWMFLGKGDVTLLLAPTGQGGGQMVQVQSQSPDVQPMLRQLLLLNPGRYVLSWKAQPVAGGSAARVRAVMDCSPMASAWQTPTYDQARGRWTLEVAPDGACPAHWLIFAIAPGPDEISIADIRLDPKP